jgi:inorganic pyrophosphatase
MDAPAHVGCLIDVRLIGVIKARQSEKGETEENCRLLGVSIHSYNHEGLSTIDDMDRSLLKQIEEFFVSYNKQREKKFKVTGIGGPKQAVKFLKRGIKAYKKKHD